MRKVCRRRARREGLTIFLLAFGLGLFVALFCSLRLALFFAAVALIYFGFTMRSR